MVKIYHINEVLMPSELKPGQRLLKSKFKYVAYVCLSVDLDARSQISVAYMISQNIHEAGYNTWIEDHRVTLTSEGKKAMSKLIQSPRKKSDHSEGELSLRSSMAGDIFEVNGTLWIAGMMGWNRIEEDGDEYVIQE